MLYHNEETYADTQFFTAFYGWLMLGEKVGWHFFMGAGIVFAGLMLFYSEEIRQGYIEAH
ncbi:MAG: hypothetical protein WD068_02370 [Candidatus Babeliales bacterium]